MNKVWVVYNANGPQDVCVDPRVAELRQIEIEERMGLDGYNDTRVYIKEMEVNLTDLD